MYCDQKICAFTIQAGIDWLLTFLIISSKISIASLIYQLLK